LKDFITNEKKRMKLNRKKGGSGSQKPSDPKRKAEAKRLFNSKKDELESKEAKLMLKFLETYPGADVMKPCLEMLWAFLRWLKEKGYHVIDERDVYCMPFSHLVRYKGLK